MDNYLNNSLTVRDNELNVFLRNFKNKKTVRFSLIGLSVIGFIIILAHHTALFSGVKTTDAGMKVLVRIGTILAFLPFLIHHAILGTLVSKLNKINENKNIKGLKLLPKTLRWFMTNKIIQIIVLVPTLIAILFVVGLHVYPLAILKQQTFTSETNPVIWYTLWFSSVVAAIGILIHHTVYLLADKILK